jgi:hypothetical protein
MLTNHALPMNWFFDLNGLEDAMYLAFFFFGHKYLLFQPKLFGVRKLQPITREAFKLAMDKVK